LDLKSPNVLIQAEVAAGVCQLTPDKIRKLVIKHGFEIEEEEEIPIFYEVLFISKYV